MDIKSEKLLLVSRLSYEAAELLTQYNALLLIGGVETARIVLSRIAALEHTIARIKREACELLPDGNSLREEFGK
jgi:hypothetical protein